MMVLHQRHLLSPFLGLNSVQQDLKLIVAAEAFQLPGLDCPENQRGKVPKELKKEVPERKALDWGSKKEYGYKLTSKNQDMQSKHANGTVSEKNGSSKIHLSKQKQAESFFKF